MRSFAIAFALIASCRSVDGLKIPHLEENDSIVLTVQVGEQLMGYAGELKNGVLVPPHLPFTYAGEAELTAGRSHDSLATLGLAPGAAALLAEPDPVRLPIDLEILDSKVEGGEQEPWTATQNPSLARARLGRIPWPVRRPLEVELGVAAQAITRQIDPVRFVVPFDDTSVLAPFDGKLNRISLPSLDVDPVVFGENAIAAARTRNGNVYLVSAEGGVACFEPNLGGLTIGTRFDSGDVPREIALAVHENGLPLFAVTSSGTIEIFRCSTGTGCSDLAGCRWQQGFRGVPAMPDHPIDVVPISETQAVAIGIFGDPRRVLVTPNNSASVLDVSGVCETGFTALGRMGQDLLFGCDGAFVRTNDLLEKQSTQTLNMFRGGRVYELLPIDDENLLVVFSTGFAVFRGTESCRFVPLMMTVGGPSVRLPGQSPRFVLFRSNVDAVLPNGIQEVFASGGGTTCAPN